MPRGQRGRVGRHGLGLHADDADRRVEVLDRHRHPGGEAAAADRDDHRAHLRALLDDLEAERSLPGHDVRVVIGMDEDGAGPVRVGESLAEGVFHAGAVQHDLRSVAAGGLAPWAAGRPRA